MHPAWLEALTHWISAHPWAAGLVAFLIAFCDALAVVGILVPAIPLLFAVGALVGMGHINGPYALICTALGALAGDALSYWLGFRFGPAMRELWLFKRYPQFIDRAEAMFRRHGTKSIFTARFIGAVRPFVPAIAGMLHMPLKRYLPPSAAACVLWAGLFLAPGWLFGTSYDAVAAVADRLAVVALLLVGFIAMLWLMVALAARGAARVTDAAFGRALVWSRAHPLLGRYVEALVDPRRPETPSLLVLLAAVAGFGWALLAWLSALASQGGPLWVDGWVYAAMFQLRNPLADRGMAAIASLGDLQVLGPALLTGLLWLGWRKRWHAALHWLLAVVVALGMSELVKALVKMPRPPTAPPGYGFPSVSVVATTVTLGFFAVLVARELPNRRRVWPYLLTAMVSGLVGFARLYLGAHWLSDVVAAWLFGAVWLLLIGLAYRRHLTRAFWSKPLAMLFCAVLAIAAIAYAPRNAPRLLARFIPPAPSTLVRHADWQREGWLQVRATRNLGDAFSRWPLDVQIAGPLDPVRKALIATGWHEAPRTTWLAALQAFNVRARAQAVPVLPAPLDGREETMTLIQDTGNTRLVLRLWQAPVRLDDGTPLWVGSSQRLEVVKLWNLVTLWRPVASDATAHQAVRTALHAFNGVETTRPQTQTPVLRIETHSPPR